MVKNLLWETSWKLCTNALIKFSLSARLVNTNQRYATNPVQTFGQKPFVSIGIGWKRNQVIRDLLTVEKK